MSTKTLSAPWLVRLNWDELATLLFCVGMDIVEYILPILMTPFIGDIIDFVGIIFCVFFFNWVGFISLFELIPGLDMVPCFSATWLIWYLWKRRGAQLRIEEELERWK